MKSIMKSAENIKFLKKSDNKKLSPKPKPKRKILGKLPSKRMFSNSNITNSEENKEVNPIIDNEGAVGYLNGKFETKSTQNETEVNQNRRTHKDQLKITESPQLPIVFCAGLMGFDQLGPLHYWRQIPNFLSSQGCKVVVTKVPPTSSIEVRAQFLKERIEKLIANIDSDEGEPFRTDMFRKYRKVHLIGHSMGGLDSRYYISCLGGHERVFSLTTIGTPHRGSSIADWSLKNIGEKLRLENLLKFLNIETSGFHQLTPSYLENEFNPKVPNHHSVKYFSCAGVLEVSRLSPMRLFFQKLRKMEGPNDGLVSIKSAKWGEFLGTFELDHMEQMNWNLLKDVRFLYRDIAINQARCEKKLVKQKIDDINMTAETNSTDDNSNKNSSNDNTEINKDRENTDASNNSTGKMDNATIKIENEKTNNYKYVDSDTVHNVNVRNSNSDDESVDMEIENDKKKNESNTNDSNSSDK